MTAFFCSASFLFAHNNGVTGYTQTGCGGGGCHSGPGSATTVSITGPTTLTTGSTGTYTLTVAHATMSAGGCNIRVANSGASAGTLSPVSGSGLYAPSGGDGELTHSTPKSMNGTGSVSFSFTWTAPSSAGMYNLTAAGNAVNGDNSSNGDLYALLGSQPYQIVVSAPANPTLTLTAPIGGQQWCAGSSQNITWTATNFANVKIELSGDGGANFPTTLAASVSAASGTYSWNIPSAQAQGAQYKIRVSNLANVALNSVSANNFSIIGTPLITTQPIPQTKCVGESVTFSVAANNATAIQWYKTGSGTAIGSGASYTIGLIQQASDGFYYAIVSGCGTNIGSDTARLIVKSAPIITQQPQTQSVCLGGSATFSVTASGSGTLTYAWHKDGQLLSNTTSQLVINPVSATDAGVYSATVSGDCSPTQSSAVLLKINLQTAVTTFPQTQTACAGQTVQMTAIATGASLTYLWQKDGNPISGAVSSTLVLSNVNSVNSGSYIVVVNGSCGSPITSPAAVLTVKQLPVVAQNPVAKTVVEGSSATFSVTATGDNLTFQWQKDGSPLAGKISASFVISSVKLTDAGNYSCVVSGYCSPSVSSATAKLTVTPAGPGPVLTLSVSEINFGNVAVNVRKDTTITALVKNTGTSDLTITTIAIIGTDAGSFKIDSLPTLPLTLKPSNSINFTAWFSPISTGVKTAALQFNSNAASNTSVTLIGNSTNQPPIVATDVKSYDFGKANVSANKTGTVKINNLSDFVPIDAFIDSLKITGSGSQYFSITAPKTLPVKIISMQSQDVTLNFSADTQGSYSAQLKVYIRDLANPLVVDLSALAEISSGVSDAAVLSQNFSITPNPAEDMATIRFDMAEARNYELTIVDMLGKEVQRYSGIAEGTKTILWNSAGCSAGAYRAILKINGSVETLPILRIK